MKNRHQFSRGIYSTLIVVLTATTGCAYLMGSETAQAQDAPTLVRAALPDESVSKLLPATQEINEAEFKKVASQTVTANDIFGATLRVGAENSGVKITLNWNDGKTNAITLNAIGTTDQRPAMKDGKKVNEKVELPDAIIQIGGLSGVNSKLDYYIRPKMRRYRSNSTYTEAFLDILREWEKLTPASAHPLKVEFRKTKAGVDVYLDGAYAASIAGDGVKDVNFTLAPTASLGPTFSFVTHFEATKFLPLDVAAQKMTKSFASADSSLKPGLENVRGVPMFVAPGTGSADIGLTREGQGSWALEVDEYLARSPFDGLLTEVHFTVPGGAPYTKAWVLAAVDPDPQKAPILTTRITHYLENGIGGNRIADTTLTLPRGQEKPAHGVVPVGKVSLIRNGKKQDVPLYLVEVPLRSGQILDSMNDASLDLDFFGKPGQNLQQIDNSIKPDPNSTSAVQIFGVTLEKSPVGLNFVQSQPSNIFHDDEKPETTAILNSLAPGKGKLVWEVLDAGGKKVGNGAQEYSFGQAGEEKKINIPLKMPELGWYALNFSLQNAAGQTMLRHPASFVLLGRDERKAGYDSPYATWWFSGTHLTPKDIDIAGPVMFKAGIRRAGWMGQTEKEMAKYGITKTQINMPFQFGDLENPAAALENGEKAIRDALEKWPHLREVAVFHESGPGNDVPQELIGLKPDNQTPDRIAFEKRYLDLLNMVGPFFREKFPQLKLVVGNNNSSASNIAAILRHGGNPDFIDAIGIETPSQVFIPEKLQEYTLQGTRIAMDTAKVLSGRDIPATGCYEFTYRAERDMGQQQQAQWYARDALISLSNKFTTISPGILFDASDAYYNGLWGASGMLERAPYGYPKKSYAAYAVLTNVLDQVKFRRQIPTGSTTVYSVEFDRADKKFASAFWAARGEADFIVLFAADTPVRVVDMFGRVKVQKTTGGKLTIHAGASPTYAIAQREIKSVTLVKRSFPDDAMRAAHSTIAAAFDNVNEVTLDDNNSLDTPQKFPLQLPVRQLGKFEIRQAKDAEKGTAIEIELKTNANPNLSKYITEYSTLRLKNPVPVEGQPEALGVWVKGNSNWGRPMFEIEDAKGEIWKSVGAGGWGVDILDWAGNLAVNFDGWNFVALPLRDTKLFHDQIPSRVQDQWVSSGGDKKIDFPIKIRALTIEMNRTPLDLIDFKTAKPIIQVKNVSGIYDKDLP